MKIRSFFANPVAILIAILVLSFIAFAESGRTVYTQVKAFALTGGKAEVSGLILKRDRVTLTLTGTIYFTAPVEGKVTGAVFLGQGVFKADLPPSDFERDNVRRLLGVKTDAVESDFTSAVFKFSDDTFSLIGKNVVEGAAHPEAQKIASEIDARILEETGANLSSRITASLLNGEQPGFFFANFNGGKRGRFSYVFDAQNRVPTDYFEINAGEKGLIFSYDSYLTANDIWMAFPSLNDYQQGAVSYSDTNDLIDILHYDMNVDLRTPKTKLGLKTKVKMQMKKPDARAIQFTIGEDIGEYENKRLKKQMRIKAVRLGSASLETVQEDWEAGLTVFLPDTGAPAAPFELEFDLEGDFLRQPDIHNFEDCSYPRSNSSWYPRHGHLDRSTFDFTYTHPQKWKVASTGTRLSEQADPTDKNLMVTRYSIKFPIALATFAIGPFERYTDSIKWESGGPPTPLEFTSMSGDKLALKEDFILAELNNSVRNFNFLFGKYPYDTFGAVFHPYGFGQGFATMLTIPNTDRANKYTYAFLAHETAHQWWGNIVSWRSYRDQWLSEGFAEYSGVLYTALRQNPKAAFHLIEEMRRSLKDPPETLLGQGKGRLVEVGPIILGHRLETKKTFGAYSTLIYNKGALILRMIHFLMTNPSTGNGDAFYTMMKDFVERYRNKVASTDDFRAVANEHFAKTPIAQRYGLKDLNWFFNQWVYHTELPSYKMNYQVTPEPDGTVILSGTVTQENAGEKWLMPLPVVFKFANNKSAYATVIAYGPSQAFKMKLPSAPVKVELDPEYWVLSEKTSTSP